MARLQNGYVSFQKILSHPNNKAISMNLKKTQLSLLCVAISLILSACTSSSLEMSCGENARLYANSQKEKVMEQFKKDADDFGIKAAFTCGVGGIIVGIPLPVISPIIGLGCSAVGKYATNYYLDHNQEETNQKALEVYTTTLAEKLDAC